MQLLLRGQRLGPFEGLLCFSPFACMSLLVGVVTLELPGLRDGGLAKMAERPLVFLGQACSEHSPSAYSHRRYSHRKSKQYPLVFLGQPFCGQQSHNGWDAMRYSAQTLHAVFAVCAKCGHLPTLAILYYHRRRSASSSTCSRYSPSS